MFVSLNKKILYTISIFLVLTFTIFLLTFFTVYGRKFIEEQRFSAISTLQISELSYRNIVLEQEINNIIEHNSQVSISEKAQKILHSSDTNHKEIHKEYQRLNLLTQNYNKRYRSMEEAIKIIIASGLTIVIMILILGILIRNWLLIPIKRLSKASDKVSAGDLTPKIKKKHQLFRDELSNLTDTFNQMIINLKQSFDEIKSKEYFLQSLIDSIPDGIRVIDEEYNIIIANKAYYRQIGRSAPFAPEKCYFSSQCLNHPCPANSHRCPLKEIKKHNLSNIKVIQSFGRDNNHHYSINAAPMTINHNTAQEQTYIVEAIRDLSGDIEYSHQQKISSFEFLGTSIAHEIKNHLGSIRLISEAMLEQNSPHRSQEDKEFLQLINTQIHECINVPERILNLSRESLGENSEIDCAQSINEVIALLDYEAKRSGIIINFINQAPQSTLYGNSGEFKMIIINLIQNAIKAMPTGGKLEILLQSKSNKLTLSFTDSGCGIAKKDIQRIFEPFYSTKQGLGAIGTGLGLPIVKSIVEKFSGKISVKSKLKEGSCFTIKFSTTKKKTN